MGESPGAAACAPSSEKNEGSLPESKSLTSDPSSETTDSLDLSFLTRKLSIPANAESGSNNANPPAIR